mmetsp:Transcript_11979/g.18031  ORF Transcript_11979/g.18031 Transcript_11979/m.18031 type:complete len:1275 (+) Transcript_11979:1356-5180(+)|eukprot:CAMPEP_0196806426 /NCGR_PEP_ID=MMETSP1362-20130617/6326_1 /TAXON_ID=163516 /ORGANISM="Leptocylindrus danicus, Strain CCMP1856" /LENGTH=1274 /DNA_ID=CAMNT_0042179897 /DNA_START=77 /DNA_END=3901 /DNA_ORIENTATION=+
MARSSLLLDLELNDEEHSNIPFITEVSSRRRKVVTPAVVVVEDEHDEAPCSKLAEVEDENTKEFFSIRRDDAKQEQEVVVDRIFHWDDRLDGSIDNSNNSNTISIIQKELKQDDGAARTSFAAWMKRTAHDIICSLQSPPQQQQQQRSQHSVSLPQSADASVIKGLVVGEELSRQQKSRLLVVVAILSTTVRSELQRTEMNEDNKAHQHSTITSELMVDFLELFLDPLVMISKLSSSRTNLTAQSFKLACIIIHHVSIHGSQVQCSSAMSETANDGDSCNDASAIRSRACNLIWKSLLTIRDLILCKRLWNEAESTRKKKQDQRRACNGAVITDFMDVVDEMSKLYHEDRCQPDYDADQKFTEKVHLCQQFAGMEVNINEQSGRGSISTSRFGGFACLEPDLLDKCSAECMVNISLESAQLHLQLPSEGMNRSTVDESQRIIARAFASWLGSKSKSSLSRTFMSPSPLEGAAVDLSPLLRRAMEANMTLMSSSSTACVNLSLAALNCLWSESNGIPPDIFNDDGDCIDGSPRSFDILVDIIRSEELNTKHPKESSSSCAPSRALYVLLARCICSKPLLFPRLICRLDLCDATVGVTKILSQENAGDTKLANAVCRFLLDNIGDKRIQQEAKDVALFKQGRNEIIIPRLLEYILHKRSNRAAASAASDSICHLLLLSKDDSIMNALAEEICKADDGEGASNGEKEPKSLIDAVGPFVGAWRRSLLERGSRSSYANSFLYLGKYMLDRPSQSAPLTLFGAFVGDGSDLDAAVPNAVQKIRFAVLSIVRFACQFLSGEYTSSRIDTKTGENMVFERLSPLLLLRRIPSAYFRICHSRHDEEKIEILTKLGAELSARLGIGHCPTIPVTFSSEERRLSAELAGRCLPFEFGESNDGHLTACFGKIFEPVFREAVLMLFDDSIERSNQNISLLRRARAGIYAACHAVPSMTNYSTSCTALTYTIGFALRIMCASGEDDNDDYIQLQTGCTEFLSICIERWLLLDDAGCNDITDENLISSGSEKIHSDETYCSLIIEELHAEDVDEKSCLFSTRKDSILLSDALPLVLSIFSTGIIPDQLERIWKFWHPKEGKQINVAKSRKMKGHESAAAIINCMNAIILASKRCSDEEGSQALLTLKRKCIPIILSWSETSSDYLKSDPLSVAVALQLIFVLITRSRTFDGFGDGSLRAAHRWSLDAVKTKANSGNEHALGVMRSAGLKLMLAIVTIAAQTDNLEMCLALNPGEFGETISVLRGAANLDANIEVRKLAFNILSAMNMS